ncbi:hypothetical protein RND71_032320 [Anisodus tanguticus]|uniref:Uncharacterized protein n=1 Tax=Anisodus tanguticus TaxID=243964 RepID=A0AAE1RCE5_9SOLA|nr:hypothetical protein RND71_032320 [Anisodus tanguticus]
MNYTLHKGSGVEKICMIAVDRSQGQLLKISIPNFGNKKLLNYIAQSQRNSLEIIDLLSFRTDLVSSDISELSSVT